MRCAIGSGSFFSCEMAATFTTTGFFVAKSFTVIDCAGASIEVTVPAMLRNDPDTISSAANEPPSALREPRARSWSPTLI